MKLRDRSRKVGSQVYFPARRYTEKIDLLKYFAGFILITVIKNLITIAIFLNVTVLHIDYGYSENFANITLLPFLFILLP